MTNKQTLACSEVPLPSATGHGASIGGTLFYLKQSNRYLIVETIGYSVFSCFYWI